VNESQAHKHRVLEFLKLQDPTVLISEPDKDHLKSLIDALVPFTAVPDPIKHKHKAAGVWNSLFASFGANHSAEKPVQHRSNLGFQSFGKLPMTPIHVHTIHQEITADTHAYNNVIYAHNDARNAEAAIVMKGTYSEDPNNPQRYPVAFYNVSLQGTQNQSPEQLREQFGLEPDVDLDVDVKPPTLHSDIVYLDDDIRINFGNIGGFYVLQRSDHKGFSV
jgi:hypothetical protein